jgi:hypothetical protein
LVSEAARLVNKDAEVLTILYRTNIENLCLLSILAFSYKLVK